MSRLLKELHAYRRGRERAMPTPLDIGSFLELETKRNFDDRAGISRCTGYSMRATVGVNFWANEAEYKDARDCALRMMVTEMYAEVFMALDELHGLLYAGEMAKAHDRIEVLRKELMEGSER